MRIVGGYCRIVAGMGVLTALVLAGCADPQASPEDLIELGIETSGTTTGGSVVNNDVVVGSATSIACDPPGANGPLPLEVLFQAVDKGTDRALQRDYAYHWDFGDGATGEGVEVRHTYVQSGLFTVVLSCVSLGASTDCAVLKVFVEPDAKSSGGGGGQASTLSVTPATGFEVSGPEGGPFTPDTRAYTLTNGSDQELAWSASVDVGWLSLSQVKGVLNAKMSQRVVLSLNAAGAEAPAGEYVGTVWFRGAKDIPAVSREVVLHVASAPEVLTIDAPVIAPLGDDAVNPGVAYSRRPTLASGTGQIIWSLVTSPAGMTIHEHNGKINWADPQPPNSVHSITIKAENEVGSDVVSWQLTVNPAVGAPPVIAPLSDDAVDPGVTYSRTASLSSGTPPATWSLVAGPTGLTIGSSSGVVTWPNPQPPDSVHTVTIRASNSAGSDDESWQLTVNHTAGVAPVIAALSDGESEPGVAYSRAPSLTAGSAPVTWTLIDGPAGMSINSDTGAIAWADPQTPNTTHTVTIRATNASGSDETTWQLYVRPELASLLSQFGITWTFDQDYRVGQFVNGDWWVTPNAPGGTVTITSITRPHADDPNNDLDGSQINPTAAAQGYDSREWSTYDASVNAALLLPNLTLIANQSLVSTISWVEGEPGCPGITSGRPRPCMKIACVLTCLSAAPPTDAFRPCAYGDGKTLYRASMLRWDRVPTLTPVASAPSIASLAADFEKFRLEQFGGYSATAFLAPSEARPWYGATVCVQLSDAALRLCLDDSLAEKELLMTRYVQHGIDLHGAARTGTLWRANGGVGPGRKLPILFAGLMLDDPTILAIGQDYPATTDTFAEDSQTWYVGPSDIGRELRSNYAGTARGGSSTTIVFADDHPVTYPQWIAEGRCIYLVDGTGAGQMRVATAYDMTTKVATVSPAWALAPDDTTQYELRGYEANHVGMPEYGIRHSDRPFMDCPTGPENEYRGINGNALRGGAIAARILGLRTVWQHEPFFDYMDRYYLLTEPGGEWSPRPSGYQSAFAEEMWVAYRDQY